LTKNASMSALFNVYFLLIIVTPFLIIRSCQNSVFTKEKQRIHQKDYHS
jgi:hypothetical protein